MHVTVNQHETAELGQLQTVSFEPNNPAKGELGLYFGGINARIGTLDTFAASHALADCLGIKVLFVERPGDGSSTLPAKPSLRKAYERHGYPVIADAVLEAVMPQPIAEKVCVAGVSLGAQHASETARAIGPSNHSVLLFDSGGLRQREFPPLGVSRYLTYLPVEAVAVARGRAASIEQAYGRDGMGKQFQEFLENNPEVVNRTTKEGDRHTKVSLARELGRMTSGQGIFDVALLLEQALEDQRPFELRASRSAVRKYIDPRTPEHMNSLLDQLDARWLPDEQIAMGVRYGFDQCGPRWHNAASSPAAVKRLVGTSIDDLARRLR